MPRRPKGVGADDLRALLRYGHDSPVLRARIRWAEVESFRKYVEPMVGVERVYPTLLPTQASLRWSTTDPPLVNFPKDDKARQRGLPPLRGVVVPDPGWWWLGWDWDAIEAKLVAGYSGDTADLAHFAEGHDLHTITACQIFGWPLPPELTKDAIATSPACADWRRDRSWMGSGDLRRVLAKTARYSLGYGPNEHAILNAPGVEELELPKPKLLQFARQYLAAKPVLTAWKARTWARCRETREARTFLGHRRRLFGKPDAMAREGLNHMIQGAVAGIMDLTLIRLIGEADPLFPNGVLALQAHDGAKIALPDSLPPEYALARARPIVERTWTVDGHDVTCTAEWEATLPDGSKRRL